MRARFHIAFVVWLVCADDFDPRPTVRRAPIPRRMHYANDPVPVEVRVDGEVVEGAVVVEVQA